MPSFPLAMEEHFSSKPFFQSLFQDNPYFSAGFGLVGVGAGLAVLRQGVIRASHLVRQRLMTSLEVTSRDPGYFWLLQWLERQPSLTGSHYSLLSRKQSVNAVCSGNSPEKGAFTLLPSPGTHWVRWRPTPHRFSGVFVRVNRERERSPTDALTGPGNYPFETLTLTLAGRRPQLLARIIEEARSLAATAEVGKVVIYTAWGSEWRPFGVPRPKRPIQSVVLAPGLASELADDLEEFLRSNQWYQQRGIPYRRGYLLEGPPGTGKSSFVQALAGELGYSICVLNLTEGNLTDDRLAHLLNTLPERTFLLLEDIDAALPSEAPNILSRLKQPFAAPPPRFSHGSSGNLSLSGLLNALDGVIATEERVIFMTSNHPETLDPALLRPGRIDRRLHFGLTVPEQAAYMFRNFYPQAPADFATRFSDTLARLYERFSNGVPSISPAAIQGHFIMYKESPEEAVNNAAALLPGKQGFPAEIKTRAA
jgi:chaperone BCS1